MRAFVIAVAFAACTPRAPPPPAYEDPCVDATTAEFECPLPDGRHGWCRPPKCADICGPNATYSHLGTNCVKPCGPSCKKCNRELAFCIDESEYGTEVAP